MLSLGTPSRPSVDGQSHFRNQESGKKPPVSRDPEFFEYYDVPASHHLMLLGVIMLTSMWNKTTKLIYSEPDLQHGEAAREFIAL